MPDRPRHLRLSDLRALVQLATEATTGVARIAEGVHQSVWSTLGVPGGAEAGRTRGITRLAYRGVEGATRLAGQGADRALARWLPRDTETGAAETPQRAAVIAALNGVMGDRLADAGNPLATVMRLHLKDGPLDLAAMPPIPNATGHVLLLVHGLAMNELQWRSRHGGEAGDHGAAVAAAIGATAVYLRYNSGLHISRNGYELAGLLEQLLGCWPVPVTSITVLAHSMGGLVARSAVLSAQQRALRWPALLRTLVFLGTPHHGAPLERAGSWVDVLLDGTRWTAPFARLGKLRSAGITDLRYGHVRDNDWQGRDRFQRHPDRREPAPLPEGVACYTIAGTLAGRRSARTQQLVGDGLVPLDSALGVHADPRHSLGFAPAAQWVAHRTGHLELLSRPEVRDQLLRWLGKPRPGRG